MIPQPNPAGLIMIPEWIIASDLSLNAIGAYAALAYLATHGDTQPAYEDLAALTRRSARNTNRASLRELETAGAIRVHAQYGDDGERRENSYTLAGPTHPALPFGSLS